MEPQSHPHHHTALTSPAPPRSARWRAGRVLLPLIMAVALAAAGAVALAPTASATERGTAPTALNITGDGGYRTASTSVSRLSVTGFGGGMIYYPTNTEDGPYPAVAISPGFTATWSSLDWLGPRLASWGVIVIGIETLTTMDQPGQRGDQLLAALDYLTTRSSVASRVDGKRLGVAGHSMGGGGTLEALSQRPALRAGVPLAPWNMDITWGGVRAPVMIVGGQADAIAPVAAHSIPFYGTLGGPKGYVELLGASHFFPQFPDDETSQAIVSWFKRFLDDDTRFSPYICFNKSLQVSDFRSSGVSC